MANRELWELDYAKNDAVGRAGVTLTALGFQTPVEFFCRIYRMRPR